MSELDEVAELLKTKTSEGKLKWTMEGESRITTEQGNNIVEVIRRAPYAYSLSIRNYDGILLAQEEFSRLDSTKFSVLEGIFLTARRASLGVDKAILDVKKSLLHL